MTDESVLGVQRMIWAAGDYPAVAKRLLPISVDLVTTVGVSDGDRVLDVGVGDGNTAIEAARRGAVVTGVDLTPEQIDRAHARVDAEGLAIDLQVANAESLPLPDAAFDTVVSVMGMIFAPDHEAAAAEMARVCRPGGTVAVTTWANDGWYREWRAGAATLVGPPPAGGPDPDAWADPDEVARRLAAAGLVPEIHSRAFHWDFPSAEFGADFFLSAAGAYIAFKHAADAAGTGDKVRDVLLTAMESVNDATDGTCRIPAPYFLAVAHRPAT
jgi:SAM-dependent methyltransferase